VLFRSGSAFIWAEVDTESRVIERQFVVYGTGHNIQPGHKYIGTFFSTPFVWHVYEDKNHLLNTGNKDV